MKTFKTQVQCAIPVIKRSTYGYDKYEGHNNEAIISLINDLNDAKAEIRNIENAIEEIQNNCGHEYMFSSRGMYEDCYTCKKCGHDTWK